MKYIVIGLGTFGSSLAEKLTRAGHEVIGVDRRMERVELIKDKIATSISLDATDAQAVSNLPLKDTDIVVVAIGENEGANIMASAVMKQFKVKRLISRAVSPLHQTVLEAMGITEIAHPEEETAERWAKKLDIQGVVDSFEIAEDYNIIEAKMPERFFGKTLSEIDIRQKYRVLVLNTLKEVEKKNIFGVIRKEKKAGDLASAETKINEGDIMALYGKIKDIRHLLQEE